jgi:hypothetical protein
MITITAGGVVYAWSRWSSGSIWPLGHARGIQSGNGSMERHCRRNLTGRLGVHDD